MKTVAIVSGGLDSTTLLHKLREDGLEVAYALSFDYGQKHLKELDCADYNCDLLGIPRRVIDLHAAGLTELLALSGSSLVKGGDAEVPDGHYAAANMASTVVPNRNMIMLSIAAGVAASIGAHSVALGVHGGDHFVYPDCRPEFIASMDEALTLSNDKVMTVLTPYIYKTKTDIAFDALRFRVPLEYTWSCYKGGDLHCGTCGTCVERLEAIHDARAKYKAKYLIEAPEDTTQYEDTTYWKTVTGASK